MLFGLPVVTDTYQQHVAGAGRHFLWIVPASDLVYGGVGGLIVFQFDDDGGRRDVPAFVFVGALAPFRYRYRSRSRYRPHFANDSLALVPFSVTTVMSRGYPSQSFACTLSLKVVRPKTRLM